MPKYTCGHCKKEAQPPRKSALFVTCKHCGAFTTISEALGTASAVRRQDFEDWVLAREHKPFGWLDKHWFERVGESYANEYIHGLWVMYNAMKDGELR